MTIFLITLINIVFRVYFFLILVRVIFSWIQVRDNVFTRFVYGMTEPVLRPFRRLIPPRPSFPIDFSPIVAIIVLGIIERVLMAILPRIFF
jgi:YggT family protein